MVPLLLAIDDAIWAIGIVSALYYFLPYVSNMFTNFGMEVDFGSNPIINACTVSTNIAESYCGWGGSVSLIAPTLLVNSDSSTPTPMCLNFLSTSESFSVSVLSGGSGRYPNCLVPEKNYVSLQYGRQLLHFERSGAQKLLDV